VCERERERERKSLPRIQFIEGSLASGSPACFLNSSKEFEIAKNREGKGGEGRDGNTTVSIK
jgi:hypothetical protein